MRHGKGEIMNILITGGTGFLGGRIVKHFLNQKQTITIASRTEASAPEWCKGARMVVADWSDIKAIRALCSGQDIIIHGAGMNAQDCIVNPASALQFNGVVTAQIAKAAADNGVKKFFFLSTAHVYNAPLAGDVSEETCTKNNHPYAFSKRAGEQAVLFAQQQNSMEGFVLRLSNIFGAPAHANVNVWTLLVNDLCKQAVTSGKMNLHTAGIQCRDFLPMGLFLQILSEMMHLNGKAFLEPVFNVGSGQSLTILEMAQLIQMRYETLFQKKIMLEVSQVAYQDSPIRSFNFLVDKIKEAGIFSSSELAPEIDEVLLFCSKNFC
jgi:UDP-glucose 4-epimerase